MKLLKNSSVFFTGNVKYREKPQLKYHCIYLYKIYWYRNTVVTFLQWWFKITYLRWLWLSDVFKWNVPLHILFSGFSMTCLCRPFQAILLRVWKESRGCRYQFPFTDLNTTMKFSNLKCFPVCAFLPLVFTELVN